MSNGRQLKWTALLALLIGAAFVVAGCSTTSSSQSTVPGPASHDSSTYNPDSGCGQKAEYDIAITNTTPVPLTLDYSHDYQINWWLDDSYLAAGATTTLHTCWQVENEVVCQKINGDDGADFQFTDPSGNAHNIYLDGDGVCPSGGISLSPQAYVYTAYNESAHPPKGTLAASATYEIGEAGLPPQQMAIKLTGYNAPSGG